jgi:hypothetical protein
MLNSKIPNGEPKRFGKRFQELGKGQILMVLVPPTLLLKRSKKLN